MTLSQVNWHRTFTRDSGLVYDHELRTPVVERKPDPDNCNEFWMATGVIPWRCWAHAMPGQPHKLAIIARHWNICRPLGLPSPPDSTEPLPSLLTTPDPELRVAVEEEEGGGREEEEEEEEEWPSDEEETSEEGESEEEEEEQQLQVE